MTSRLPLILSFVVFSASAAECCTIPVFRYALDRWEADKFHLLLPASLSQDSAVQDLLRPLRANGKANLDITTSQDPAFASAELRSSRDSDQRLWSGKLDKASMEALLDSPARRKVVEQILAGDSVVWIIANDGSATDMVEVERIEKRLKFLEQVASLPIQDPNDPDSQLGPGPPLRLKFATLRLRRDDPSEQVLLKMLAGPKGEFDPGTTSFAAAVFGRGRVLGAWPLTLLDDASLEDVSMFLVGRCGCRMKNQNPGWDLLLNVDWEKALPAAGEAASAPAAGADELGQPPMPSPEPVLRQPEVVKIGVVEPEKSSPQTGGRLVPMIAGMAGIALIWMLVKQFAKG